MKEEINKKKWLLDYLCKLKMTQMISREEPRTGIGS